jgi:hypothetical protein
MKKMKPLISLIFVFVVIGTALAFKPKLLGQGAIYCNNTCTQKIDWRVSLSTNCEGQEKDPCLNGLGKEYVLGPQCVELTGNYCFEPVAQ